MNLCSAKSLMTCVHSCGKSMEKNLILGISALILENIIDVIENCSWNNFFDICEILYRYIENAESFRGVLNSRFRFHSLAWRYDNQGRITRVWPEHVDQAITDARKYLDAEERFMAARAQFNKAVNLIQQRPDPDYANAIKDIVGAVESVSNIIKGTKGSTLSSLMDQTPYKNEIDPTILDAIKKIYAYRGNAEAVAHGAKGNTPVGEQEANLMITLSSGIIAYLIAKFSE